MTTFQVAYEQADAAADQIVVAVAGLEDPAERLLLAALVGDRLQGVQQLLGYRGIRGRAASILLSTLGAEEAADRTGLDPETLRRMARTWQEGEVHGRP